MAIEGLEDFSKMLTKSGADISPTEAHGMLAGLLCGRPDAVSEVWVRLLYTESMTESDANALQLSVPEELNQVLDALYQSTSVQLISGDFDFKLLLPADDYPLAERAYALAEWSRGFLFGFGVSDQRSYDSLPDDVSEMLRDYSDIAQLEHQDADAGAEDGGEDEERAYFELVEYVRMGAMMIYQTLNTTSDSDTQTLH